MTGTPDFSKKELKIVQESVNERYCREIEPQLADADIRPDLAVRELIEVPAIFWLEETKQNNRLANTLINYILHIASSRRLGIHAQKNQDQKQS